MTVLELAEKVLGQAKGPMSATEIWELAVAKGYDKELHSNTSVLSQKFVALVSNLPWRSYVCTAEPFSGGSDHADGTSQGTLDADGRRASET